MNRPIRTARDLALFGILVLGAACGGDQPAGEPVADEFGEPVPGGTAIIAEGADMTIPISIIAQSAFDGNLGGDVMFMELLRGDWRDGRLVFMTAEESPMAIARSYEFFGPDSASVRLHMRSGLRWSDGEPITADDVVFTYSILDDPGLASPLQHYKELIESVEAENDSTVVFHYSRRNPEMLTHAAAALIPEHVFGDVPPGEIRNHPTVRNPENGNLVVSGPYMVGGWERGQRIVLVRNPEFQPAAFLDQLVFRIIPDPTTRLVELQTGSVDFVQQVPMEQIPMLRTQAPHVRFELEEKRFYDYVGYNPTQFEAFADPDIRRALGLAANRQAIIEALQMQEFAVPAGGPYPPIFADLYDPEGQSPLPYDPEQARQILESKGWVDTNEDGVRERNGQPFRFTLMTNTGNQRRADVAQILQQQWREIGVDARLQVIEFNTMTQALTEGTYEAVVAGWSVGLAGDLTPIWSPDSPFNYVRYDNPEVNELMDAAQRAPTAEAAAPLWRQAASLTVRDQPYTWLYYLDSVDGVNNRLRGTKIDTYGPYQNTWEWWIPESMQR